METRWLSYDSLLAEVRATPSAFTPWLRIYLDTYAERIFTPDMLARA